jgi:lipopolysaccharide export LptBFGC system permease protein LptF
MEPKEMIKKYRGWVIAAAVFCLVLIFMVFVFWRKARKSETLIPYLQQQNDSLFHANQVSQKKIDELENQKAELSEKITDVDRQLEAAKKVDEKIIIRYMDAGKLELEQFFAERYFGENRPQSR